MIPLVVIAVWIGAVNGIAFAAFGIDKQIARNGGWRISERTLLLLALAGGTIGAFAGRRAFRHKTRKEPFRTLLIAIAVLQVALIAGWLVWRALPIGASSGF